MAVDRWANTAEGRDTLGSRHVALTPNDGTDIAEIPKALYCKADGTAVIRDIAGTDLPYTLTAGQIAPVRPVRLLATGTTGTWYGIY